MLPDKLQALAAGLLYALGWMAGILGTVSFRRRLISYMTTLSLKPSRRIDWRWWGQIGLFLYTLGALYLWLANGTLEIGDVGLRRFDITQSPNITLLAANSFALVCLLWTWLLVQPLRSAPKRPPTAHLGFSDIVTQALTREAGLAILRGALIPLLGPYWGIWMAIVGRSCVILALPQYRQLLGKPVYRQWLLAEWALDWVSASLFFFSASMWPGLVVRLLSTLLLRLILSLWLCLRFRTDTA